MPCLGSHSGGYMSVERAQRSSATDVLYCKQVSLRLPDTVFQAREDRVYALLAVEQDCLHKWTRAQWTPAPCAGVAHRCPRMAGRPGSAGSRDMGNTTASGPGATVTT